MTKYVVNSGGLRGNPEKMAEFFTEVVDGLGDAPKVLMCFFAEPREDWEKSFESFKKYFESSLDENITPVFELAFPDEFEQQCKNADAIYIHGGDDYLLRYWMDKFNVSVIWKDRTIGTNSASSSILATSYWTCDWRQCFDGFGVLPIKFIPHFNSEFGSDDPRGPIDWQVAKDELAEYGDKSLPIYALEEAEYVVFNV